MASTIDSTLACAVSSFPVVYLGLPLSVRKTPSSSLLPLVDKIMRKLATWKAALLTRGERLALVRHVLSAMPVHILMAIVINPSILKKIMRIIRDFLWHGRRDARSGSCLVSWPRVCRPIEFGGLGVRDLYLTGISLRCRWLWLKATDPARPWHQLQLPMDEVTSRFFRASTSWHLGDGKTCLFWSDHWLDGQAVSEIAPGLFSLVPSRRKRRTVVCEGLEQHAWIRDIHGTLGIPEALEYIHLWRKLQGVALTTTPDKISWRWTSNGIYSAKSCYHALFHGSTTPPSWKLLWRSWAPLNTKFFLWLASLDRCWTAERRARHGLTLDAACVLCHQETESIDHLLAGCVFARVTWHEILAWCRLITPPMDGATTFFAWWALASATSPSGLHKGLNSIVALTAWAIWKHRNAAIFDGVQPSTDDLVVSIQDDARLWAKAGAKGLASIIPVT